MQRAEAPHGLRGGALPEHRRVLAPRHRDVHDSRRRLHPRLRLLRGRARQAERRSTSAEPARVADAIERRWRCGMRRDHIGRSRRPGRRRRVDLRRDHPPRRAQRCAAVPDRGARSPISRGSESSLRSRARRAARRARTTTSRPCRGCIAWRAPAAICARRWSCSIGRDAIVRTSRPRPASMVGLGEEHRRVDRRCSTTCGAPASRS